MSMTDDQVEQSLADCQTTIEFADSESDCQQIQNQFIFIWEQNNVFMFFRLLEELNPEPFNR